MTDKWVFIVNPVAGSGSATSQLPKLEEMIGKNNLDAEIIFTKAKGHASELSGICLENGTRYIIGVGGDGTINEIARPLIGKPDVVTGLIPAGTGNDFIQILGFPNRFGEKDWETFFRRHTMSMDIGSVNGLIFLNGMGLGFDAQVAAENYTKEGIVKEGGKNKYIWHIIKTLLFFREKRMTVIKGDESHETDCFINTIAIGRRFAGGFLLTPKALANDGLLDVCSIKKLSLPQRFRILLKVPEGKHINDAKINYFQTPALTLHFPEPVPFHVDGELYFSDNFKVSLIPSGLQLIYNPDGPHFLEDRRTSGEQVVFFDLDRTLIREISGKAIVRMAWTKGLISLPELARAFYLYLLFKLRLRNPLNVIDDMIGWVKGKSESEMKELCLSVFREVLLPSLFIEARNEIKMHRENNATLIILSSALDFICRAMSDSLGMDGYLCSSIEAKNGHLTGRPEGRICYGEEKLHRLTGYCAAQNIYQSDIWYYSDSISDLPVLSYVGNPVCINPDRGLKKEALKRGWRILFWEH